VLIKFYLTKTKGKTTIRLDPQKKTHSEDSHKKTSSEMQDLDLAEDQEAGIKIWAGFSLFSRIFSVRPSDNKEKEEEDIIPIKKKT
jgi:hypothetical protein